ncbi:vacuolar h+-atpase assembly [Pyrrhoderma noxium]|uniref:Vacuolar h+-atpase assembly n=1 Tax=Pyrrhoderma noxium TaxID=2282107 RepID=A0A286UKI2_9AGAM|nr:vacuolar h+-atpase assembly [Pyrrhoderma noxium]
MISFLSLGNPLSAELTETEIRYSTLSDISRWTRSAEGSALLKSAHLNSGDYHLVSLLAGTKTSPRSKPPPYTPPESPEKRSRKEWNDRKALTAVANSLLSIGCAGGAAWWIADKQGWKDEWKVLVSLMIAVIVGVSETILFIIWQTPAPRSILTNHKKGDISQLENKKNDDKEDVAVLFGPLLVFV